VVRIDILERLADLVRPAVAYRPGVTAGEPPPGAADGEGFVVTVAMTSLTGCSGEAFSSILRSLGYIAAQRLGPAITVPLLQAAPMQPFAPPAAETPASTEAIETAPSEETPVAAAVAAAHTASPDVEAPVPTDAPRVAEVATVGAEPAAEEGEAIAAAPETVEPVASIDIWSQQRHAPSGPRRQGGPGKLRHAGAPAEGEAASAAAARPPRPERGRERHHERPQSATRGAGRGEGGGKPRPDRHGGRDDESRNQPGGAYASTQKRERDRQPDPDSPFAMLAALKAELEKKGKS